MTTTTTAGPGQCQEPGTPFGSPLRMLCQVHSQRPGLKLAFLWDASAPGSSWALGATTPAWGLHDQCQPQLDRAQQLSACPGMFSDIFKCKARQQASTGSECVGSREVPIYPAVDLALCLQQEALCLPASPAPGGKGAAPHPSPAWRVLSGMALHMALAESAACQQVCPP